MKLKSILSGLCLTLAMGGCIQDEALNVEAAIDGCTGSGIQSLNIDYLSKTIEIYVLQSNSDLQELIFTLPEGATIQADTQEEGDNPPLYDFGVEGNIRSFTVTAEDGVTQATYRIRLNKILLPTFYNFENLRQQTPYHIIYLSGNEGIEWSSGNPGFQLTGMGFSPTDYPTMQIMEGYHGNGVCLRTSDTGSFGTMAGMRIAAGNLFVGSFDVSNALQKPLEATHFGYPFTQMPVRMTGWYKYQSGGQMTDKDGNLIAQTDKGDFYAVLYEAESSDYSLDGNLFHLYKEDGTPDSGQMEESIVLIARIPETVETGNTWTHFDLPFESVGGKTVDRQALADGKYKLAVVFSSSLEGAYFRGAVGSTLWIDEVRIECE